jgi:hypothetical protein
MMMLCCVVLCCERLGLKRSIDRPTDRPTDRSIDRERKPVGTTNERADELLERERASLLERKVEGRTDYLIR